MLFCFFHAARSSFIRSSISSLTFFASSSRWSRSARSCADSPGGGASAIERGSSGSVEWRTAYMMGATTAAGCRGNGDGEEVVGGREGEVAEALRPQAETLILPQQ